jgi:hypothetical protein
MGLFKARPRAQLNKSTPTIFSSPIFGDLSLRITLRATSIQIHQSSLPSPAAVAVAARRLPDTASVDWRSIHPALLSLVRTPWLPLTDLYVVLILSDANPKVRIFRSWASVSIRPVPPRFLCFAVECRLGCLFPKIC